MEFAVPGNYSVNIKENQKRDKYLDFARKVKKPGNKKLAVILFVIGSIKESP